MIADRLENAGRHYDLHPLFRAAFEFLASADLEALAVGKYPVDGENVCVIIARDEGRGQQGAKLEAHRRYIDIQYVIEGQEVIGAKALGECHDPIGAFDEKKDIVFFADACSEWTTLSPGEFVILFPDDAHAPLAGEGMVRKAIVKVAAG